MLVESWPRPLLGGLASHVGGWQLADDGRKVVKFQRSLERFAANRWRLRKEHGQTLRGEIIAARPGTAPITCHFSLVGDDSERADEIEQWCVDLLAGH
jgi:hypothetical protein